MFRCYLGTTREVSPEDNDLLNQSCLRLLTVDLRETLE